MVQWDFLLKTAGLSASGPGPEEMSVEAFKAQVSADAAERSRRRARCRARAEEYKKQANEYFKVGDMESAIKMYTKAVDVCRDWAILYNNRALVIGYFIYLSLFKCHFCSGHVNLLTAFYLLV